MPKLPTAPTPKQFANAFTREFAANVRGAAGRDGRLSANEATKMAPDFADNAVNYLEAKDQKSVSVNKLIGKAHDYAFANAAQIAGNGNRVSLVEARNLPDDLRSNFYTLRGKEDPTAGAKSFDFAAFSSAINQAATLPNGQSATYTSESDYDILPVSFDKKITPANVMSEGVPFLDGKIFDDYHISRGLTFERQTGGQASRFFDRPIGVSIDDDPESQDNNLASNRIGAVLRGDLKNIEVYRIGPKANDGSLGIDRGRYAYLVIGEDAAGNSSGVYTGSVET